MGWDGAGAGGAALSRSVGQGNIIGRFLKMFGQNSAFWFVLSKKMCPLTLHRNIKVMICHGLLG